MKHIRFLRRLEMLRKGYLRANHHSDVCDFRGDKEFAEIYQDIGDALCYKSTEIVDEYKSWLHNLPLPQRKAERNMMRLAMRYTGIKI